MNQRTTPRYSRHLQVRFRPRDEDRSYAGYTTNISRSGMFIKTNFPCAPGARVRIEVNAPDDHFTVEGRVVHAAKVAPSLEKIRPSGMGVRFLPAEELVGDLLGKPPGGRRRTTVGASTALAESGSPAAAGGEPVAEPDESGELGIPVAEAEEGEEPSPRAGRAPRTLAFRFSDTDELMQIMRRDISDGGLFVPTPLPPQLDRRVIIELHLPESSMALAFPGRVVMRIEPGPGRKRPGAGVAFEDPKRVLEELRQQATRLVG